MPERNEDTFFVRVKSPAEFRKNLLECVKDLIQMLRGYESLRLIREEKLDSINHLTSVTKDLDMMYAKLKQLLPLAKINVRPPKFKHSEKEAAVAEKKIMQKEPQGITEVQKLEQELDEIEKRLEKLG